MSALCGQERFAAAQLLLTGEGIAIADDCEVWALIARRAHAAGQDEIAHAIRRSIWNAGVLSSNLALAEAEYLLQRGEIDSGIFVLERVFGAIPAERAARHLAARLHLLRARSGTARPGPKSDRQIALDLNRDFAIETPQEAMVLVDLLRFSGELSRARARNAEAIALFPDDVRLRMREARLLQQMGELKAAIDVLEAVVQSSERYRVEALFILHDLTLRIDRSAPVEDILTRLAVLPLSLAERLRLAIVSGQAAMVQELVRFAVDGGARGDRLTQAEGAEIGDLLLDNGDIGLLDWLRRQRVPLSDRAKRVLDGSGLSDGSRTPRPASFNEARAMRSPGFLLPIEQTLAMDPKPEGWPGSGSRPKKLLLVNASLGIGGAERQFVELVRGLMQSDDRPETIETAIFSLSEERGQSAFLADLEALGVVVHNLEERVPANPTLPPRLQAMIEALPALLREDVRALWFLVQETGPDALHGWQDRAALACGVVGIAASIPRVVLAMRNMSPPTRRETALMPLKPLYAEFTRKSNVLLCANSRAGADDYARWVGCDRDAIAVLSNAVDVAASALISRRQPGQGAPIRIGGVFRLAANKRPLLWLQIVAALRRRAEYPIAPVLFGGGPLSPDVDAMAQRLGMTDLEIVPGQTDQAALYGGLDLMMLVSRVEGTPNVLLEAQARGLPVVACDAGGAAEAMLRRGPERGLLLPLEVSPEQAADKIAGWLPAALAARGADRRRFVERFFSPQRSVDTALGFYAGHGGDR